MPGRTIYHSTKESDEADKRWLENNSDLFQCHGTTSRHGRCTNKCPVNQATAFVCYDNFPSGYYCHYHRHQRKRELGIRSKPLDEFLLELYYPHPPPWNMEFIRERMNELSPL